MTGSAVASEKTVDRPGSRRGGGATYGFSPAIPSELTPAKDARPKRTSRLQRPGLIYAIVTVFVAIGAVNSQNNLLFIVFGLLVGCVLASGIIGGTGLMGVRATRVLPGVGRVGQRLTIRYRLTTRNRLTSACGLIVEETPTGSAKADAESLAFVDVVRPRRATEGESVWTPTARGVLEFPALLVRSRFPFGLMEKRLRFELPATLLVRPARVGLSPRAQSIVRRVGTAGATASRRPGMGDEFVAIREYAPGDSIRRIAWKPSARLGSPVVRLPGAPMPRRAWVVLGARPDAERASIERAVAVAATLIEDWSRDGQSVGLLAAGVRIEPAPGRGHASRLLDVLATWQPPGEGARGVVDAGGCVGAVLAVQPRTSDGSVRGADAWLETDEPTIFEGVGVELPASLAFPLPPEHGRWWSRWRSRPAQAPRHEAQPAKAKT